MSEYILRRLAISVPVLVLITAIIFVLLELAPGDPLAAMLAPARGVVAPTEEYVAELRKTFGLDRAGAGPVSDLAGAGGARESRRIGDDEQAGGAGDTRPPAGDARVDGDFDDHGDRDRRYAGRVFGAAPVLVPRLHSDGAEASRGCAYRPSFSRC